MREKRKNLLFAAAATLAVCTFAAIGFWSLGSPGKQRELAADRRRVEDLQTIARSLNASHRLSGSAANRELPSTLHDLPPAWRTDPSRLTDPATKAPYEYRRLSSSTYELCASFATESSSDEDGYEPGGRYSFWRHPKGRHCFLLDAVRSPWEPR